MKGLDIDILKNKKTTIISTEEALKDVAPYDDSMENLGFSTQTYIALKRAGINFASEILNLSDDDLKNIRNISEKRLNEIKQKVNQMRD